MTENFIVNDIRNRLTRKNKNWLAVVCGETGSGKSYSAMKVACSIDKDFNIDRVVFTPEQFMTLLNGGTLKSGSMVVFDEAGVGLPAREFASLTNKLFNYVLQTFRYRNIGVMFTLPSFSFLDVQARKLLHGYIETLSINREKQHVIAKYFKLQVNPRMEGKIYFQYPRMLDRKTGKMYVIDRVHISLPPKELTDAYEEKKAKFATKLNENVLAEIQGLREKFESGPFNPMVCAQAVIEKPEGCIVEVRGKQKADTVTIMTRFGIGRIKSSQVARLVEQQLANVEAGAHTVD